MTTDTLLTWDFEDQLAAGKEGWDLFSCGDSDHEPFELERVDFPDEADLPFDEPKFDDDTDAWEHVIEQATAGSPLHNKALAFLMQESPGELVHIAMFRAGLSDACPCASCNRQDHPILIRISDGHENAERNP